ncbi:MAG: hypothetical protein KAX55_00250 [Propionivibrio sp.]|nr:hypothetical protein [Propionivibrio sp.]
MKVKKPAKVRKPPTEKDVTLAKRLGFLRQANRITLQSLADQHGTQRSNLSAFVTSGGQIRNIAYDKMDKILFELGMLPDGTLTPNLHRWQVEPDMVPQLAEILVANDFQMAALMLLSSGSAGFLVVRVTGNILVFASLDVGSIDAVFEGLSKLADRVKKVTLDRSGDSAIQSMWMTEDDVRIEKLLLSLLQG